MKGEKFHYSQSL